MTHQDWQDLIPFYVAKTLSPDDVRHFEAHLAECESCQQEINDWRQIASAVWHDADSVARQLPPLSPNIYAKINQRKHVTQSEHNQPTQAIHVPSNIRRLPQQRSSVPLTLVAGIVVAVLFGGLLMFLALGQREQADTGEQVIALNATNEMLTEGAAVGINGSGQIFTVTPRPTDLGIIPTLSAGNSTTETPNTPILNTSVPLQLPPIGTPDPNVASQTGVGGENDDLPTDTVGITQFNPTVFPTLIPASPTHTPELVAPLGGGPYITITPNVFDGQGLPYCELFNPTTMPIELYERADRNSQITIRIVPDDLMRVIAQSNTGWFLVESVNGNQGWIQTSFAYLRGNCDINLPIATVVPTATRVPSSVTPQASLETPTSNLVVVVSASFADLYQAPTFESEVLGVASRDEQFPVIGYQGTGTNRWVRVQLTDGSSGWLWASIVTEYPAGQVP